MKRTANERTANELAADLLARALALPARWALRDAVPVGAGRYLTALDGLLDAGLVERVPEGCGRWHYRLTPAGRAAAGAGGPVAFGRGYSVAPLDRGPASYAGLTPRQAAKRHERMR